MLKKPHKQSQSIIILGLFMISMLYSSLIFKNNNLTPVQDNDFIENENITNNNKDFPLKTSDGTEITIISPDNKTYSEPMSGYYPATYGFECDKLGYNIPKSEPGKEFTIYSNNGGSFAVDTDVGNHKNILRCQTTGDGRTDIWSKFGAILQNGSIEFYFQTDEVGGTSPRMIFNLYDDELVDAIDIRIGSAGYWGYFRGSLIQLQKASGGNMDDPLPNKWYHFKLAFETRVSGGHEGLSQWEFKVWINGTESTVMTMKNNIDIKNFCYSHWDYLGDGYTSYIDAIGYSWDSNYELGDNLKEGLLLSYTNTTVLNHSSYILDSGLNITIQGNTTIPFPKQGTHRIQVFGNSTTGQPYSSDTRYFKIGALNLVSPENKTYSEPMSGYYPATYGFESDEADGTVPEDWTEGNGLDCNVEIANIVGGHNKVVKIFDNSIFDGAGMWNFFAAQTHGTVEYWLRATDAYDYHYLSIYNGYGSVLFSVVQRRDKWSHFDSGAGWVDHPEFSTPLDNTWYHVAIHIELRPGGGYKGLNQYYAKFAVNGKNSTSFEFPHTDLQFNRTFFSTLSSDTETFYVDAMGYSWDPSYEIGDNLKEGLLVSYTNTTNLDWVGYSLDGQSNISISGNTTIPLPKDGGYSIQLFANTTLGYNYSSDPRYFSIHHITVITPENKSYIKENDGYYPATYGFENDIVEGDPTNWEVREVGGSSVNVIAERGDHKKIVEIYDNSVTEANMKQALSRNNGSIEFWIRMDSVREYCVILHDLIAGYWYGSIIKFTNTNEIYVYNGAGYSDTNKDWSINTWYHIKLIFDCDLSYWNLWIDGDPVTVTGNPDLIYSGNPNAMTELRFETIAPDTGSYMYIDAIGYNWSENYEIGGNKEEGLLVSHTNSTNLNVTGYTLDGIFSNHNLNGNFTIPLPTNDGPHCIQMFGNDSLGKNYSSQKRFFSTHRINITSPENKTYTAPMSGYYPATYGFESDINGSDPVGWEVTEPNGDVRVINNVAGHSKVAELLFTGGSDTIMHQNIGSQSTGTVEFWCYITDKTNEITAMMMVTDGIPIDRLHIDMRSGNWAYYNGGSFVNVLPASDNTWYHHRVEFDCGTDTYDWYIDGVLEADDAVFRDTGAAAFDIIQFLQVGTNERMIVDAIGYSWDPEYEIGDNQREGLLIAADLPIYLNLTDYSLDGAEKLTIFGNTTIPMPNDGYHTIQLFANNSKGENATSNVRGFTINVEIPSIQGLSSPITVEQYANRIIEWNITGSTNGTYTIKRNGVLVPGGSGSYTPGVNVSIETNSTTLGQWNYTLSALSSTGKRGNFSVIVNVVDTTSPLIIGLSNDFSVPQGNIASFSWKIVENNPGYYKILKNSTLIKSSTYQNNTGLSFGVDTSTIGDYKYQIIVNDTFGRITMDEIIISVIARTDGKYYIPANTLITLDLTSSAGVLIKIKLNAPGFIQATRRASNFDNVENIWGNLTAYYFYSFKIFNINNQEDESILENVTIELYYDASEVKNPSNLYLLHYILHVGGLWIWDAEVIEINTEDNCIIFTTTELSYFCLAEIDSSLLDGDNDPPFIIFLKENLLIIIILSAIGISVPSAYVITSKNKNKKNPKKQLEKKKGIKTKQPVQDDKALDFKESARKKREALEKRTWTPEEPKYKIEAKKKEKIEPKKAKQKKKDVEPQEHITEEEKQKIQEETKKTETEMEIKEKLDRCTVHKGAIEGMNYVCPKCHAKYCMNCAQALKSRDEACWVCETVIQIASDKPDVDIEEIPLKKQALIDFQRLTPDERHEKILLNASSIFKIWLFDSKDNSEIYNETLDPKFLSEEKIDFILPEILKDSYERDKFIEKAFKIGNQQAYCLVYFSSYFLNLILISKMRIEGVYHDELRKVIENIEENFVETKKSPKILRGIIDNLGHFYLTRKYSIVPGNVEMMLKNIIENEKEIELIKSELQRLPEDTFTEYLELFGRLTEEMNQIENKKDDEEDDYLFE